MYEVTPSLSKAQTKRLRKDLEFRSFSKSLLIGSLSFVVGITIGFASAVYDHDTFHLSLGLAGCGVVFAIASLRLPIVYHNFISEPANKWRRDSSKSLYAAIITVGFTFGLGLPAEFMLLELVVNDPTELRFERGGWVAIAILGEK